MEENQEGQEACSAKEAALRRVRHYGVAFRKMRVEAGLTQVELAERTGTSVRAISVFERTGDATLGQTDKWCAALIDPTAVFLQRVEEERIAAGELNR